MKGKQAYYPHFIGGDKARLQFLISGCLIPQFGDPPQNSSRFFLSASVWVYSVLADSCGCHCYQGRMPQRCRVREGHTCHLRLRRLRAGVVVG